MDVIQEVGSYAGFAAVVGLAVLAALFFSQARDVRRLREWAGRGPERAAEQAAAIEAALGQAPQVAAEEPAAEQPAAATPAVKPIPSRKPAAAAAAGADAATAVQAPATKDGEAKQPTGAPVPATAAAANAGQGAPAKPAGTPAPGGAPGAKQPDAGGKPPATGKPAPATPAAGPAAAPAKPGTPPAVPGKPAPPGAPAAPAAGKPPVPAVPRAAPPAARPGAPARPGPAPVGRTPAPAPAQSTAVLPPSARVRGVRSDRGPSGGGGLEARYIALIVAGLIVVGGGVVFGVSQIGGDDGGSDTAEGPRPDPDQAAGPLNRSLVTVSVLNGTTVPGLAAQIGDEVEAKGFQRGNVANAIDQQRTSSVVLFAEGAERPARVVARNLGISAVEPIDPDSQALAGNASVVVVVGADQTQ